MIELRDKMMIARKKRQKSRFLKQMKPQNSMMKKAFRVYSSLPLKSNVLIKVILIGPNKTSFKTIILKMRILRSNKKEIKLKKETISKF